MNKFLTDDSAGEPVDLAPIYASLDTKLLKTGDTMTGDLKMGSNKITSSYTATDPDDLVNQAYITANTITNPYVGTLSATDFKSDTYLSVSTAIGDNTNAIGTNASNISTNASNIATNTTAITNNTTAIGTKLTKSGDAMTGPLGIDINSTSDPAIWITNAASRTSRSDILIQANSTQGRGLVVENVDTQTSGSLVDIQGTTSQTALNVIGNVAVEGNINLTTFGGTLQKQGINTKQLLVLSNGNFGTEGSLTNLTTGSDNLAVGSGALTLVSSGSRNVGIGFLAAEGITTGSDNTAIGTSVNIIGTSSNNTVIGNSCAVSSGNRNLLLGNGNYNTDVLNNVFSDGIVIGNQARLTANQQCRIGSNNVGYPFPINQIVSGTNQCDLGSSVEPFKDLYLAGSINNLGVIGNLFTQTQNGTALTTVGAPTSILGLGQGTLLVVANTLVSGSSFRLKVGGLLTCGNANDQLLFSFPFLGYTTPLITCNGATSQGSWELEMELTIRSTGVAGSTALSLNFAYFTNGGSLAGTSHDSTTGTIDTTTNTLLDLVCILQDPGMSIETTTAIIDKSR